MPQVFQAYPQIRLAGFICRQPERGTGEQAQKKDLLISED